VRAADQGLCVHTQRRQGVVGIAPHELAGERRAHERQVSFRLVQGKLSNSAHVTFGSQKSTCEYVDIESVPSGMRRK
jgi:hypothetical protein